LQNRFISASRSNFFLKIMAARHGHE